MWATNDENESSRFADPKYIIHDRISLSSLEQPIPDRLSDSPDAALNYEHHDRWLSRKILPDGCLRLGEIEDSTSAAASRKKLATRLSRSSDGAGVENRAAVTMFASRL